MTTIKSLFAAALISTVAVASFAQAPAQPKDANKTAADTAAPADAASKPMKKHVAKKKVTPVKKSTDEKKAEVAAPAASTAK
ncbi:hypothetical protein [Rhodoferax sp.]|uniref:hypothetical protein n=1 Tax=Rhodoferax sp. TaxID=50421 RepID=UPI00374CD13D